MKVCVTVLASLRLSTTTKGMTAACGSEFVAARTATEQIIDDRLSLRHLGVPVKESFMFGDNESVVNSSNMPAGKLHKRHIALSWHMVRETIAANVLRSCACQEPSILLTCLASIGGANRLSHSCKRCCFGKATPQICSKMMMLCSVSRGVSSFPHVNNGRARARRSFVHPSHSLFVSLGAPARLQTAACQALHF